MQKKLSFLSFSFSFSTPTCEDLGRTQKERREASIIGHESEGVVTPAGFRAWSKRDRAEARGGGEGVLG